MVASDVLGLILDLIIGYLWGLHRVSFDFYMMEEVIVLKDDLRVYSLWSFYGIALVFHQGPFKTLL